MKAFEEAEVKQHENFSTFTFNLHSVDSCLITFKLYMQAHLKCKLPEIRTQSTAKFFQKKKKTE